MLEQRIKDILDRVTPETTVEDMVARLRRALEMEGHEPPALDPQKYGWDELPVIWKVA